MIYITKSRIYMSVQISICFKTLGLYPCKLKTKYRKKQYGMLHNSPIPTINTGLNSLENQNGVRRKVQNQVMSSTIGRLSNQKRSACQVTKASQAIYKDCCSLPTFHTAAGNQATLTLCWQGNKILKSTIWFLTSLSLLSFFPVCPCP